MSVTAYVIYYSWPWRGAIYDSIILYDHTRYTIDVAVVGLLLKTFELTFSHILYDRSGKIITISPRHGIVSLRFIFYSNL